MGCTSSNLNRQHSSGRRGSSKSLIHKQKQAISVVSVFLQKSYSLRLIRSQSDNNIPHSLHKKEKEVSQSLSHSRQLEGEEDDESEDLTQTLSIDLFPSKADGVFSPVHLLESPRKLCTEQERRLRCANMEGPVSGLTDLSSDEDDDEGDGFEFAKLEGRIASFNSEQGHIWTPITSFNSEQASKKVPLLGALLDSPRSEALTIETSCSEIQDSSILEPEFQLLISPDYTDVPFSDSDNQSLPLSPASICSSSQVSPCSPSLERFPSNSVNQLTGVCSTSDDSLYFPGFATHAPFECGSFSPSSASFSESFMDNSPASDAFRGSSNKWIHPSPSWRYHSFSDSPPMEKLSEDHHTCGDFHGSRWGHPSPSPAKSLHVHDDGSLSEALIPGLPNDLAQLCLMRVPFIKYNQSFRMVCRRWRDLLSSEEFFKTRNVLGIHEAHISFVVHGNRVQIFSLLSHQWFCLPPLPREDGNTSPGSRVSPDWSQSPDSQSSPQGGAVSDWAIDPYDWWQIDTVAVSGGTLFVIGGDQAEIHSFTRPSKPTNRVHKYDFCRNCWVSVTPMQVARSHAAAVSLGELLYVAGGSEDIDEGASAEAYDLKQNKWSMISSMNTSMRTCVGVEHEGCVYVKGENLGPGCHVEGEVFNPAEGRWGRMRPGMRKGLERGPITSCDSFLFVADWKDSLLKVYDFKAESWIVVTKLPARISRLVGHSLQLYALTGKIKVDPFNHHVISDVPAEVWRLDVHNVMKMFDDKGIDERLSRESEWECIWRDSKQMVKTGALAWVPCIAHCMAFED
ncbi:hypothetical protein GOP47_0007857 [Adiantum capillus-veneris]|uniref:F-box domain-containing protein n=1 Tax=Adiantum capillus-veneris TaxID=13818 RepID=A0A9D4V2F5_ADICA|nr:hypothetical protein GOP47_0007857 [Adiantum capillus-veneris]